MMSLAALRRSLVLLLLAVLLPGLAACSTAPATGDTIFTGGLSLAEEKKLGAEQHPKILQQFGGEYEDPELDKYVSSIGRLLAQTSEMPQLDWTFTILDSKIINAFALPGGYVYVTRGLITLAENEAQLAGVLAHEIGHVTARHSAERYGSSQIAGLATVLSGVLLGQAGAQVTGGLSQVALASYSRSQESEADTLGVRYLSRVGYAPEAMASFLEKMQASSELQATLAGNPDAADDFNLLQTHPRTADRVWEAIRAAGTKPVQNPMHARDIYLSKIAGVVYGDSPAQGFIRGHRFLHPELHFAFQVPSSFSLRNSSSQVVARGPDDSAMLFDRADGKVTRDLADYLANDWAQQARLQQVERLTINGMPAATGVTQARTSAGTRQVRLVAIRYDTETVYRFLFVQPTRGDLDAAFEETAKSFRKLGRAEAEAIEPYRLHLRTVQAGDTVDSLAKRLPYNDHQTLRFRVLNGLKPNQQLEPGRQIKLVE